MNYYHLLDDKILLNNRNNPNYLMNNSVQDGIINLIMYLQYHHHINIIKNV